MNLSKMSDYIDRQAAIDALDTINCYGWLEDTWKNVCGIIERVPSADVVEVVRCKDCRYFNKTFPLLHLCNLSGMKMVIDAYCSYGERKDETD